MAQNSVTLHQLLKTMVEAGGTDLHVTTNSPPQIRVHGKLTPLQLPPFNAAETKKRRGPARALGGPHIRLSRPNSEYRATEHGLWLPVSMRRGYYDGPFGLYLGNVG